MQISVLDPYYQTALFVSFLIFLTVFFSKKDLNPHEMNHSHTQELKGVAILMVIFSHVGYFLFSDHRFLFPLSVAGGVGVNIFLFLSGFGLTSSEIKSKKTVMSFYSKRLKNIFIPMWLVLTLTLIADRYLLGRTYNLITLIQNYFGFFPNSDLDTAINSPLWYFSLILYFYLIFPFIYRKNKPVFSILGVLLLGYVFMNLKLPVTKDVFKLYELHYLSFPLGMIFAYINKEKPFSKFRDYLVSVHLSSRAIYFILYSFIILLTGLFAYLSINSGVGEGIRIEQTASIFTVLSLVLIFLLKNVQSNFLILLGTYSYEIYLIQWPLLYRYDFIYKHTAPFLGTILYIFFFLFIGFILSKITKLFIKSS
jgi:peptidoglycan/LPS O-acetylase OafA/YrhL